MNAGCLGFDTALARLLNQRLIGSFLALLNQRRMGSFFALLNERR